MFEIQGVEVKQDKNDLVNLTDIWKASGKGKNYSPYQWSRKEGKKFIDSAIEKLKGESGPILETKKGRTGGTYAHWQIALTYAKYLSPELHMEVNKTFIRAKSGDVTLADEIADKASPEDQKWLKARMDGKVARLDFTGTLKDHGVKGPGYAQCTDAVYIGLIGKPAKQIREDRGLKKNETRDGMTALELAAINLAEMAATKKIEDDSIYGNMPCAMKCGEVATKIKAAIS